MLEVSMKLPSVGNYRIFKTLYFKIFSKGILDLQVSPTDKTDTINQK